MKRSDKSHINDRLHTSLANSGRAAGIGVTYDRYDEESGYRPKPKYCGKVRLLSDSLSQGKISSLHGDVIIKKNGVVIAKYNPNKQE